MSDTQTIAPINLLQFTPDMKPKDNQSQAPTPAEQEVESPAFDILLNVPKKLAALVNTTLLLSLFTGILYAWGINYYYGFIRGLSLESYNFAFSIPANDILLGGANTLGYFIIGASFAYWSVSAVLIFTIVVIVLMHLILLPVLKKLSIFLAVILRKIGKWVSRKSLKLSFFRKVHRLWRKLTLKLLNLIDSERTIPRLWNAAMLYFTHGMIIILFVVVVGSWGARKSHQLGMEAAKQQLRASTDVEIVNGEGEKIAGKLCGRIGNDYILRVPEGQGGKYVIVKESAIQQIPIIPQATASKLK